MPVAWVGGVIPNQLESYLRVFPLRRARPAPEVVRCRLCAQEHRMIALQPGDGAYCTRCGSLLARGSRNPAQNASALALTALILAIPAWGRPLVTVTSLGREQSGYLATGAIALWRENMGFLAVWVVLGGILAPIVLYATLAGLVWPASFFKSPRAERVLVRLAHACEYWCMPEVHVLAVLVALAKLGSLVGVRVEEGLWFYAAMSVFGLLAWRSFEWDSRPKGREGLGGFGAHPEGTA